MSTSRMPALSGPSKKISSWVRPGVWEVRASALRPVSALIRLDLPTLERPANATSMPAIGGSVSIEGEAQKNCQSPANSFRPCSISFASMSAVIALLLAMTGSSGLRFNLLRGKHGPEIVEQFNLHAVAPHDEALLHHRQ